MGVLDSFASTIGDTSFEASSLGGPTKLVLIHGETDSSVTAWANAYGTNLQDWLDAVIPTWGVVQYVLVRLSINVIFPSANVAAVRAAQELHPFIDIDDLPLLPDGMHYTAGTSQVVGERIAAALNLFSERVNCVCTGQSNAGVRLADPLYQATRPQQRQFFYNLNNPPVVGWRPLGPANGLYGVERSMGAQNYSNIIQVYKGAAGFADSIGVGQPDFNALVTGVSQGLAMVPPLRTLL